MSKKNVTNIRRRGNGTTFFISSSDASCYVRDMCPDPAQPRWIETILGVCCSGLKPVPRNHVARGPGPCFSRRYQGPLGVNKSGKGERYVSDLCSCLVHLMGI